MGFNFWALLLTDHIIRNYSPKNCLMLGRQVIHIHDFDRAAPELYDTSLFGTPLSEFIGDSISGNPYSDQHYFPSRNVDVLSLDYSDYEKADIIADLSIGLWDQPLDTSAYPMFDMIFDIGTSEHVGAPFNSIRNAFYLLKPGGIYVYDLPYSHWHNHGLFQFTPAFFSDLCKTNGYELITQLIKPTCRGSSPLVFTRNSICYNPPFITSLLGVIRKPIDSNRLISPPRQTEYITYDQMNEFSLGDRNQTSKLSLCNFVPVESFSGYLRGDYQAECIYLGFDKQIQIGSFNVFSPLQSITSFA